MKKHNKDIIDNEDIEQLNIVTRDIVMARESIVTRDGATRESVTLPHNTDTNDTDTHDEVRSRAKRFFSTVKAHFVNNWQIKLVALATGVLVWVVTIFY